MDRPLKLEVAHLDLLMKHLHPLDPDLDQVDLKTFW